MFMIYTEKLFFFLLIFACGFGFLFASKKKVVYLEMAISMYIFNCIIDMMLCYLKMIGCDKTLSQDLVLSLLTSLKILNNPW